MIVTGNVIAAILLHALITCIEQCKQAARNDNYGSFCWVPNGTTSPTHRQGYVKCKKELERRLAECEPACLRRYE